MRLSSFACLSLNSNKVTNLRGDTEDLRRHGFELSSPRLSIQKTTQINNVSRFEDEDFRLVILEARHREKPLSIINDEAGSEIEEVRPGRLPLNVPTSLNLRRNARTTTRKERKVSRHGIPVPALPSGMLKKLSAKFARTTGRGKSKINKESLAAIEQATEWFFEQISEDLGAYSKHAGRRTIDETDIVALMRR